MRAKTKPSLVVVTNKESEERGIHSAASKFLVDITDDQVREQSVVVFVRNKDSEIWKDMRMKASIRRAQLKYIDVGGLWVVTNNRCVAETCS